MTSILTKPRPTRPSCDTMSWPTSRLGRCGPERQTHPAPWGDQSIPQLQRGSHHAKRWLGSDCRGFGLCDRCLGHICPNPPRGAYLGINPLPNRPAHHRGQASHRGVGICAWPSRKSSRQRDGIRLRGVKGTTGTQASFLSLFDGDHDKVDHLERLVAERMGFSAEQLHPVTGQTYPRLVDAKVLVLGIVAPPATSGPRMSVCSRVELKSKNPSQRSRLVRPPCLTNGNPMRCERACGLARFVMNLVPNTYQTAATQWLERTLDDSANRRLTLAEGFWRPTPPWAFFEMWPKD